MIVSYKYGFILFRIKKTASTAVELGLSTICGPEDIISPMGRRQELLREQSGVYPRNFNKDKDLESRYVAAVKTGRKRLMREILAENLASGGCTGHMSAARVKTWVSDDFWNSAYKFATERHPYEKAVSLAYFRKGNATSVGFEEHLDRTVRDDYKDYSGFHLYAIDGQSVMDGYLLQHTLNDDIERLRQRLNLPAFELPRARSDTRIDRRPASEILSDEQKEFIYSKCKAEFDLFGWKR